MTIKISEQLAEAALFVAAEAGHAGVVDGLIEATQFKRGVLVHALGKAARAENAGAKEVLEEKLSKLDDKPVPPPYQPEILRLVDIKPSRW